MFQPNSIKGMMNIREQRGKAESNTDLLQAMDADLASMAQWREANKKDDEDLHALIDSLKNTSVESLPEETAAPYIPNKVAH
jgi:cell division FtsZ-interacting protein ZapD